VLLISGCSGEKYTFSYVVRFLIINPWGKVNNTEINDPY